MTTTTPWPAPDLQPHIRKCRGRWVIDFYSGWDDGYDHLTHFGSFEQAAIAFTTVPRCSVCRMPLTVVPAHSDLSGGDCHEECCPTCNPTREVTE